MHLLLVLTLDDLADVEGDAALLRKLANEEELVSTYALTKRLLGAPPEMASIRTEACLCRLGGTWRIYVRRRTPAARARWLVGHELGHWLYRERGLPREEEEARCDAMGAALVVPRRAFQEAIRNLGGHRVHRLASAFVTTQSIALLRIGEVTGRPGALVRQRDALVRGEAFGWPPDLQRAAQRPPPELHPLRITDEIGRVGLMARAA